MNNIQGSTQNENQDIKKQNQFISNYKQIFYSTNPLFIFYNQLSSFCWDPQSYQFFVELNQHYKQQIIVLEQQKVQMIQNYQKKLCSFQEEKNRYTLFMENHTNCVQAVTKKRSKRRTVRRTDDELVKNQRCPHNGCKKQYASILALNLHRRRKHKIINKKELKNNLVQSKIQKKSFYDKSDICNQIIEM